MLKFHIPFLQEIQLIAPEQPAPNEAKDSNLIAKTSQQYAHTNQQTCKRNKQIH